MIDLTAEFVAALADDAELAATLDDRVFGFRIPEKAEPPLALVLEFQTVPAARPTSEWWRGLVSIDIHAETPGESLALSKRVAELVPTFVGAHASCVIADSQVESIQAVIDDAWTPTRFRQVVTVVVAAREP